MKLNEEQNLIVVEPPTLKTCISISAGAGSGKSTTICHRVAHLINHHKISKNKIHMSTFSNRAARDLRGKLKEVLQKPHKDLPSVTTTHGFCLDVLRQYSDKEYIVISEWDNIKITRDILEEHMGCSELPKYITSSASKVILAELSFIYSTYDVKHYMDKLNQYVFDNSEDYESVDQHLKLSITFRDFYEIVNKLYQYKEEHGLLSFDDILFKAFELINSDEDILTDIRKRYIYTFHDESQDLNTLQFLFLYNIFNTGHTNIVFDTMQELYSFRFSDTRYLLEENLFTAYDNVVPFKLSKNFRSAHPIVKLGNILREFGKSDIIQTMADHTKNLKNRVFLKKMKNQVSEARYAGDHVKKLLAEGVEPRDIAILTRTNRFISTNLEPIMIENNIPYVIQGSKTRKLTDRSEVLYLIYCFQLMVAPPKAQSYIVKRILENIQGIGPKSAADISDIVKDGIFALRESGYSKGKELVQMMTWCLDEAMEGLDVNRIGFYIDTFLDYSKFKIYDRQLAELKQLFNNWALIYMEETDKTFEQIIPDIQTSIDSVEEESKNAVKLTTIHGTKGLQYDHVLACGFTYRVAKQAKASDEELFAFYVQVSRAVKSLLILHSDYIKSGDKEELGFKNKWLIRLIQYLER